MNVSDIVTDTLRNLGIISEIETPSAEQGQDAVTKLNNLMFELEEDGIFLGWNPKETTAESAALRDGIHSTIKAMLGVRLCDAYGIDPPAVMVALADSGYKRLLRQALQDEMRQATSDAPRGDRQPFSWDILNG